MGVQEGPLIRPFVTQLLSRDVDKLILQLLQAQVRNRRYTLFILK